MRSRILYSSWVIDAFCGWDLAEKIKGGDSVVDNKKFWATTNYCRVCPICIKALSLDNAAEQLGAIESVRTWERPQKWADGIVYELREELDVGGYNYRDGRLIVLAKNNPWVVEAAF